MARSKRTGTGQPSDAPRHSRIPRIPGETPHQHRIRSYELRHPGTTRQEARGHHPGATKPSSAEKVARAREFMAQGSSATEAAKRAGISRETLTRELQTDPNIVKLGGRYIDRKLFELLRYRQQLGAAYKDKFEKHVLCRNKLTI
jgi:hypothetical protein